MDSSYRLWVTSSIRQELPSLRHEISKTYQDGTRSPKLSENDLIQSSRGSNSIQLVSDYQERSRLREREQRSRTARVYKVGYKEYLHQMKKMREPLSNIIERKFTKLVDEDKSGS